MLPLSRRQTLSAVPSPVSLRRLFPHASFVGCGDIVASDVTEDSRKANARTVFAAVPGTREDGRRFVADAIERGTPAILTATPMSDVRVPQCVVRDIRPAFARLSDAVSGYPSMRLSLAAVTGTNGKTTSAWLIRSILRAAGQQCGLLGTIEFDDGIRSETANLTTPDARTMFRWFRRMVDAGCSHAAIELSSHALHQGRIAGTRLAGAVVTNVTQDHFDYHGRFDDYLAAKARILEYVTSEGVVAVNVDDPGARLIARMATEQGRNLVTFSCSNDLFSTGHGNDTGRHLRADVLEESLLGTRFLISSPEETVEISIALPGRHNVLNCLGAAAIARHLQVPWQAIKTGLERLATVPGRLERIDAGQDFSVFVDYAHTDDALRRVLQSLRSATTGRIVCVFGAGGDRDRTKRPLLARAASIADLAIVTSDNPRTEQPLAIIEEILAGFPTGYTSFLIEADRRRAIDAALAEARPGDCVLIAGKGHETEQLVGTRSLPFDDRLVVRELLHARLRSQMPAAAHDVTHAAP